MRPGYFKIDETPASPAVIFPAPFMKHTSSLEVVRYMASCGIREKIVYIPAPPGTAMPDYGATA